MFRSPNGDRSRVGYAGLLRRCSGESACRLFRVAFLRLGPSWHFPGYTFEAACCPASRACVVQLVAHTQSKIESGKRLAKASFSPDMGEMVKFKSSRERFSFCLLAAGGAVWPKVLWLGPSACSPQSTNSRASSCAATWKLMLDCTKAGGNPRDSCIERSVVCRFAVARIASHESVSQVNWALAGPPVLVWHVTMLQRYRAQAVACWI